MNTDVMERPLPRLSEITAAVFSFVPRDLDEAMQYAKIIADSDLVPKDYKGRPGNVLVAMQMGGEVGLKSMQAVQSIAVINGRPSLYGDTLWALVKAHPHCESTSETYDESTQTATCRIKRRNNDPVVRTFSRADAEKAGLWNKDGPWKQYPKRMLQMRARGFAARDTFPDALRGLMPAEEARDTPRDMGMAEVVKDEEETQPSVTMPEAKPAETVDKETGEVQRTPPGLISPTALNTLTKMLADRQLTEEFCKHFGIADLSELPMSKVNPAMRWVSDHGLNKGTAS